MQALNRTITGPYRQYDWTEKIPRPHLPTQKWTPQVHKKVARSCAHALAEDQAVLRGRQQPAIRHNFSPLSLSLDLFFACSEVLEACAVAGECGRAQEPSETVTETAARR